MESLMTIIIIIVTVIVSLSAFRDESLFNKLILWPRGMNNPKEYYRFVSSGFIHADMNHLLFNMMSLFFFGSAAEYFISSNILYIILYITGIVAASMPSFIKNRNNSYYRSLGASGGVSAIIFYTIYHSPWSRISLLFIPPELFKGIPGILFGLLYLGYCIYMDKKGRDNINHSAHLWGALYGFTFAVATDSSLGGSFLLQMTHPVL